MFCDELVKQELDNTDAYIDIPDEIRSFYKMYRPSPLVRAYCLEEKLQTPAKIYYKFEGNNTSGSHKLNSAIAQAYYAKKQGLKGVTTETGAGQWGTALSMACAYLGLDCKVYMVKVSYEQKPFRREVMIVFNGKVIQGTRACKTRSKSYEAFSSINYPYLAVLQDGRLLQYIENAYLDEPLFFDTLDERVGLLKLIPGTPPALAGYMRRDAGVIFLK